MFNGTTLTLPLTAGDRILTKINQDGFGSTYLKKGTVSETWARVRHSKTKAGLERHNVEITEIFYATGTTPEYQKKVYVVVELPPDADDFGCFQALGDLMTEANLTELIGWQN